MKAIALISGGLDSLLAASCVSRQGIEIIPIHFKIPFCHYDKSRVAATDNLAQRIKDALNLSLLQVDICEDFLKMLERPHHGFGSNMNPCIDCKILMLTKAKALMNEMGASFVITGEVLGQRPMSQHRLALEIIERKSGLEGLLLRPLTAQRLKETVPEREGWINRGALLDFSGRTRRPQIKLADSFNLKNYPNASGGCLLTDPGFAKRLKDLINHREVSDDSIELLRWGRHFRLGPEAKLIVGRNEKENNALEASAKEGDYLLYPPLEIAGPTSLGKGVFSSELIALAGAITCRYSDFDGVCIATILYRRVGEKEASVRVSKAQENSFLHLRI